MARFGVGEVDNYGSSSNRGWFSLKNDKDTAQVRFMYETIDDVEGYAVHEIKLDDGTRRYVNCLREAGDSKDVCPFCESGMPVVVKFFIPLYDIDEDKVKIWERGKKFAGKLESLCGRYAKKKGDTLVSHIFEIERNGKPNEAGTTYETYEIDEDDTTLDDLPEVDDLLGTLILDKDEEEMQYYLDNGEFPDDNEGDDYDEDKPVKRGSKSNDTKSKSRDVEYDEDDDEDDYDDDYDDEDYDDDDYDDDYDEEEDYDDEEDYDEDDEEYEEETPKKSSTKKAPAKATTAKKTPAKKAPAKKGRK